MTNNTTFLNSLKNSFTLAGIKITGVDGHSEMYDENQDYDIAIITKDEDGTEHQESLFFSIDGHGEVTRFDFTGSKSWGHVHQSAAVVKAAFSKGANWMDRDGNGDF